MPATPRRKTEDAKASLSSLADFSAEQLTRRRLERRAVEAAVWGMRIVAMDAMRQAFFAAGARYGDFLYLSRPADWKFQITTPNASSLYVYFNFNTKDGPMVLEVPPAEGAGLFGSLNDAWQTPFVDIGPQGTDKGKGGRYLILPPDHEKPAAADFIAANMQTCNGYGLLRAIPASSSDADRAKAIELVKRLRLFALADAATPPASKFIDIAGKPFEAIAPFDAGFYATLSRMMNEEPVHERDLTAMGGLHALGIEKGKPYEPDGATREVLDGAVAEAHALFMLDNAKVRPWWPGSRWGMSIEVGPKTSFTFSLPDRLDIDERANMFFLACAPPMKLGAATFYLGAFADAGGEVLDGGANYRLHVPPDVPARQYWAATVYDLETAAFIREAPR
ncbi:MAG TPA: DUF1254 domain-containing protein, partial [Rhizomicrobium sp.]|nr:DUF1254 domain-containing protein [Rhizomicrobium sp.]